MLAKLKSFYVHCMLPEMANSRIAREMRVRDPEYIMLAQEKQKSLNTLSTIQTYGTIKKEIG